MEQEYGFTDEAAGTPNARQALRDAYEALEGNTVVVRDSDGVATECYVAVADPDIGITLKAKRTTQRYRKDEWAWQEDH
jgi:hypothetical protein